MINLLPPETKHQIRAARINVILYRYCLMLFAMAALLGGIFAVGFWADYNDRRLAEKVTAESKTVSAPYAKTRQEAELLAKNLTVASTILASNVSFSTLVLDIAQTIPEGVVLGGLDLSLTVKPNTPMDISAKAVSYDAAIALKNSLEASPIFEKVNIANVSQTDVTDATSDIGKRYPFTVSIKAQLSKAAITAGRTK